MRFTAARLAATATITACLIGSFAAGLQASSDSDRGVAVGDPAPDFSRLDLSGKPQHLGAYRGKTVLLNFWATWCTPCVAELPRFSVWQRRYGDSGFQVLGVSMDDDPRALERFLHRLPVDYPVIRGDATLGGRFGGVFGLPLSFLIGADGRIVDRLEGEVDFYRLEQEIRLQLNAAAVNAAR